MECVEDSRADETRPSFPSLAGAGHDLLLTVSAVNIAWAQKNVEQVKESLREFISTVDDPMTSLLDLLDHYNPTKGKANSLAVLIACEFQKWINDHLECQQSGLRLKKLQARVFPLVAEGALMDILLSIYKLEEAERSFVLGNVTHLHQMGKYKEAAILSIHLNLQPDLDLEQMCTPLLLLDRFNQLEAYVSGYPELQSQLLQMLDRWSDSSFNPRKLSKQYQGLPPIKADKLNLKTLSKLAFRLLETYNLDPALCSNMINQRHLGTLKYLMYKRFVEKTMTQENWADHVQNTADGNRWLQEQCIALLCRYSDLQTAGFWALKFGMPKETLPKNVADILQDLCIQEKLSESEKNPEDSQARRNHFYQLPIPRSKVHFLQDHTELSGCRDAVLKDGQVVGVDMEWRPSFGGLGKPNVSLIQLAVKEEVFLLDVLQGSLLQSSDSVGSSDLVTLIKDLFSSTKITKLGYGMVGDFQSLDATNAGFRGLELRNVVDLCEAHRQMQRNRSRPRVASGPVDVLENASGDDCIRQPEKGLSLLVKDVLGKPLDKKQQLSNWDKRPLREDQIIYAAVDAYCLLDVFEILCRTPEKFGLKPNFYELPKGKTSPKKDVRRSPRQKESVLKNNRLKTPLPKEIPTESSPQTKPLSPREFSVICDNMLQGLGRYLRCLGVDVLMLENDDDHRKAAEIARLDGRVILTCGMPYQTLRSQVGEGRCFNVNCSEKAKEQAIRVLKHFNVLVTHSDVFSRCQVCNCNKYLHISRDKMMQLMKLRDYLEEVRETQGPPPASPPERLFPSESLQWMEEMGISSESLLLANGTQLQLDALPAGLLDKVPLFFCCSQCGKIFWEGSHFGRVVSQFKEVLQDNGECIYQSASHQGP
ncbi:exonuclease mut-7 homolog isoform X2 [Bufo bufo]|uniref:exonuclease mut-7 homolog isoform X1 n=1 Tax=Bufo bufo TaxID=8384 RepID=UPI001ABDA9B6|nr:exonuclease mut-7 homolog isoform X1 [Bufo bufo]XP_040261263.1 exonuclease mut-7 homolog isoform X1 [Bufo bufo]XP_040261264.1 exonuclease mut-7 homolog isoform X1 [Bufo bufo]XP_040261266.1 exonuclease mut-7 homolog isoform X1 [Bufo bufo]XP_040261267.1 exonuclease mut-7 homolog isoform X2 [Bufo bufo]